MPAEIGKDTTMTTISDERLARFVETCRAMSDDGDGGTYSWWAELTDVLTELQSLRAQGGLRVKPLEWKPDHVGGGLKSGEYRVRAGVWTHGYYWCKNDEDAKTGFEDEDAAKSSAQADYERRILGAHEASPAPVSEEEWLDPSTAPKDGTALRLLVKPDMEAFTSLQDSEDAFETIGFNHSDESGEDTWHFAGWDWAHDCITQGHGEVIGWAAFSSLAALAAKGGQ